MKDGRRTKIDLSFYPIYRQYTWHMCKKGYVSTTIVKNGKETTLYLAHLVANFDPSIDRTLQCDHKNRDPSDNRLKNLRIVDLVTQAKNAKAYGNTTERGIHLSIKKKAYVIDYTIKKKRFREHFGFGEWSNRTQDEAWLDALARNKHIRETEPEYILASCKNDIVSSDGDSIDEEIHLNNPNFERLHVTNTSGHKYISLAKKTKRWVLSYYDEYGGKEKTMSFSYGPKSGDDEASSLKKAVEFKALYEKYRPIDKIGSKPIKCNTINKNKISSSEDINDSKSNESGENSNMEDSDFYSNSDTSMSEDEKEEDPLKIKNAHPVESNLLGVSLDLIWSMYVVAYFEDGIKYKYFSFGKYGKSQYWKEAKDLAENFQYSNKFL
jgi:hypothetical protein